MSKTYGQSTKESYRDDIENSLKHKTVYKNFEYFDDYSYGISDKIGFLLVKEDDEIYLYLFQKDGPKDIETLRKLLEWRRSGLSEEIGHKGGGNLRNIYGFKCSEVFIIMKIDEKNVIRCGTKPNKLFDLATSDVDEETFRNESDSSLYITNPEYIKIKNLPSWYNDIYEKIKSESKIEPNYLIRMELTEIPVEYINKELWNIYLKHVRAKQYDIPIFFKNELLSMEKYEKYNNIDVVGLHDKEKINEMNIILYIHKETKNFYLKPVDKYINVENIEETFDNSSEIVEWGKIQMFIVSKIYADTEFNAFNDKNNKNNKMTRDDFYGIYMFLNGKLTNFLPFEGKLLGQSKNNNIHVEDGVKKSSTNFRMIFRPNKDECKNVNIFNSLIQTYDVKAKTNFANKSPHTEIIDLLTKIFKGDTIVKKKKQKSIVIKKDKTKVGGVYLVYLGNGLWKFGMVKDFNKMKSRINDHKRESIDKIKEFIPNKDITKRKKCIDIYIKETFTPKGDEEKINNILEENKKDKITFFECERSSNEIREYFECDDFDYISDTINDIICYKIGDNMSSLF